MKHYVTLGRIVHYVDEDYECPAMIVATREHTHDEELGAKYSRRVVGLHVYHPMSSEPSDDLAPAYVEFVDHAPYSAADVEGEEPLFSWHWADECHLEQA